MTPVTAHLQRNWIVIAVAGILGLALLWEWQSHIQALQTGMDLQRQLGQVLAKQAALSVGKQGRILTIAANPGQSSMLMTQTEAFKSELRRLGDYEVREYELVGRSPSRPPLGSGLSWLEYQRAIERMGPVDLVVSFGGAPALPKVVAPESAVTPRLIAESASIENLPPLFARKLIDAAIVPRMAWTPAGATRPRAADCFTRHYQILTPALVSSVAKP